MGSIQVSYRGSIGIMEKNMETTVNGLCRIYPHEGESSPQQV